MQAAGAGGSDRVAGSRAFGRIPSESRPMPTQDRSLELHCTGREKRGCVILFLLLHAPVYLCTHVNVLLAGQVMTVDVRSCSCCAILSISARASHIGLVLHAEHVVFCVWVAGVQGGGGGQMVPARGSSMP